MEIKFSKYQGAGNDFIMIDSRFTDNMTDCLTPQIIQKLCNRRFGIGSDGLILLKNEASFDFRMVYYNSDGYEGTMCGNGGRCTVAFARNAGIIENQTRFVAVDGEHLAEIIDKTGEINLKMADVKDIEINPTFMLMNTGSLHYVQFVVNLENFDVFGDGRKIRYNERFIKAGTNVNFVEIVDNQVKIRTYERGVEEETFACGTGSVAAAIATHIVYAPEKQEFDIHTRGGLLKVRFTAKPANQFEDVWLQGPAQLVFDGFIHI